MIKQKDFVALLSIFDKALKSKDSLEKKKHAFLSSLGKLIDADYWVWSRVHIKNKGMPIFINSMTNFPENLQIDFIKANCDLDAIDPSVEILYSNMDDPSTNFYTVRRSELLSDKEWQECQHFRKYRKKAGLSEYIYSLTRTDEEDTYSVLAFHRKIDKKEFSPEHNQIVQLVAREITWLHGNAIESEKEILNLTPRLLETLKLVLEGYSDIRISEFMNLSPHTIRTYVKMILRHFMVTSRHELMAKILNSATAELP